jgi:hypothetical protein
MTWSVAGVCGLTYMTSLHSSFPIPPILVHDTQLLLHPASISPDSVDWPATYCTLHGGTPALLTIQSSHSTSSMTQIFSLIFLLKIFFPTSFSPHIWLSAFRTCCPSGLLTAVFNLTFPSIIIFSVLHCATVCCMLKIEMASSSEIFVPFHKTWGFVVAQLVEALRYKPEGHGLDSWWCHCNFLLT